MATYRLDIAYDGSGFRGFARNAGVRTVQGVLEEALAIVIRRPVDLTVAGRTDTGVHARHNVVSFVVEDPPPPERLQRSVNRMLGGEVVVGAATRVEDGFNARFSAVSRVYRYHLDCGPVLDPLNRLRAWHVGPKLDVAAMRRAAEAFEGEHDFASLCRRAEGRSTVRTVLSATWSEVPGGLVFAVEASSFCHQMVRSMVALCVAVGGGRTDPAAVPAVLAACDRSAGAGAAPPHGLVLWEVRY